MLARRWICRLLPLALIIVAFASLEIAARVAIMYRYGSANFQLQETLNYAPFLVTADDYPVIQFPPKQAGVTRIMIIGSSTARHIPVAVWEQALGGLAGSRVEVCNAAQGGYTSTQELLYFLLYGIDAKPDYVISLDGINDIVGLTKSGSPGIPYLNLSIERALNQPGVFWIERLFRQSQLVNAVRKISERRQEIATQSNAAANAEMTAIYRANMEKIAILCSGIGATHVCVLQPFIHLRRNAPPVERTLSNNYLYRKDYMSEQMVCLREAMRSCSLPRPAIYIDAIDAFDNAAGISCFLDEAHLTNDGAKLLMRAIRGRIAAPAAAEGK
jgi:hypothetical protein